MLTVKQLFQADGLNVPEDQIKLVRHVGRKDRSIQQVTAGGSPRDVIRIETREKAKHGSRAIGLNGN
ncbi:MAG: hypothetical protein GVY36_12715 [Verrucomicrobia bacterium]|jgi:hypothetical protein|nr:hypothetical protein [Verrucomicrobiota bacterium]